MTTDMAVIRASAPAQPANVSNFDARAARSAAMKNVLSPISETKMSDEAYTNEESAMPAAEALAGCKNIAAAATSTPAAAVGMKLTGANGADPPSGGHRCSSP